MPDNKGGARPGAGRPKGKVNEAKRKLASMAQEHAEEALQALVAIATNPEEQAGARVSAATAILDRGYGKPHQSMEHTGEGGGPIVVHLDSKLL